MQTVLNILVILSLAVQNVFAVLRPMETNSQAQGNANAAFVLPKAIQNQISVPGTKTPPPTIVPKASETPAPVATATTPAKETVTPDIPTLPPSQTPPPPDTATPAPGDTSTPTPPVDTPTSENPTETPPPNINVPSDTPTAENVTTTPAVPSDTPTGSPTVPTKLPPPAAITLTDTQNTALVQLNGAVLTSSNGLEKVTFPVKAVTQPMLVSIAYPQAGKIPYSLSDHPFEVLASDATTKAEIHQFKSNLTLQVSFDPADFPDNVSYLKLYYYDEKLQDWTSLPTQIDFDNHILTAQVNHLTVFDFDADNINVNHLPDLGPFDVSGYTGAATYSIPLDLPPAPAGLTPKLTLSYNSQTVDDMDMPAQGSWVGTGWDLDTPYVDGSGPYFLHINGATYTLVPMNNGGIWTVNYKTDPATSLQIRGYGGNLNSSVFKVFDQDGTLYLFDHRSKMPVFAGCNYDHDQTYRWSVSSVSKMVNGNTQTVHYSYFDDNKSKAICDGDHHNVMIATYPEWITYGGDNEDLYRIHFVRDNRYDYKYDWRAHTADLTLYKAYRLKEVDITYDGAALTSLRKYVFNYAAEGDAGFIFPGYTWSEILGPDGVKWHTITLKSVQEFGENGAALPATTFTYGDNMHLTDAENGYGGEVQYQYEDIPWYDTDHLYGKDLVIGYSNKCTLDGWNAHGDGSVTCSGDYYQHIRYGNFAQGDYVTRDSKDSQYKPGAMYHLDIGVRNASLNDVDLRANTGEALAKWPIGAVAPGTSNHLAVFFKLPVDAPSSMPMAAIACPDCELSAFVLERLPTHYQVTQKTLHDEITNQDYTFQYHYDDQATNDDDHSTASATFDSDGQLIHERNEFRGSAQVEEIGPDGKVTTTWYHQDDAFKGQPAAVMTGTQSFYDDFNGDGVNPYAWTGDLGAIQTVRLGGDNALQLQSTGSIKLTRTGNLQSGDTAVVQFRMTTDTSGADLELVNGLTNVGLHVAPNAVSYGFGGGANKNLITILPDHWYVLMISVGGSQTNLRVWQRDVDCHTEGSGDYEMVHCSNDNSDQAEVVEGDYHTSAGGTGWKFQVSANTGGLGKLYIDEYSENKVYSLEQTFYKDTPTQSAYGYATHVFSDWTRPVETRQYTYEGGADWIAKRTQMYYDVSDQDGVQYGNITRQIEGEWNGSSWVNDRLTHTVFIPNPAGDGDDFYTPGLPALQESYSCTGTGDCGMPQSNLISQTLYCYDWDDPFCQRVPNEGTLTAQRTLLRIDNDGPKYSDTSFGYDAYGNRTTVTKYTGTGSAGAFATFGAEMTTTVYDNTYHLYPLSTTDNQGHVMTWEYDYGKGVPTKETDYNGNPTTATYDDFGRLTSLTRPLDTSATLTISYTLSNGDAYIVDIQQRIDGTNLYKLRQIYDGLGRKVQTQTIGAKVNGVTQDILTDTWYDAYGKVVRQSIPYNIDPGENNSYSPDSSQPHSSTQYDILGRVTNSYATDGANTSTQYSLNNNELQTVVTDPKGNQTTSLTDVRGRVTQVTPATGPGVSYSYDSSDRLSQAIYGNATTTITYDVGGRKTSMTDADMGAWNYQYDALGNLTWQKDARNCETTLTYDTLNRLLEKTYASCPDTSTVYYIYDEATNGAGHRTYMSDGSGWTHWSYDARGRMTQESRYVENVGTFTTQWDYWSDDQVAAIRYPKDDDGMVGEQVDYSYQPQKTLNSLQRYNPGPPSYHDFSYLSAASYDASGRIVQRQMNASGNWSLQSNFNYYPWDGRYGAGNSQGRLEDIQAGPSTDTSDLQDLEYGYDPDGNIIQIQDFNNSDQSVQNFCYDTLNRLTSSQLNCSPTATPTAAVGNYLYDTNGNLGSKDGVTYGYETTTPIKHAHAVITAGSNSYEYDDNGNMTRRVVGGVTYGLSYDAENRLTNVVSSPDEQTHETIASYVYDGDGKMVEKTEHISGVDVTTVYISNLVELQLPSDLPNITPTVPTRTATVPTRTSLPTITLTSTPVPEPTATGTPTITATTTATRTQTPIFTKTFTPTRTPTKTRTSTNTTGPSPTKTLTPSKTPTPTVRTPTTAWTASQTSSKTPTKTSTCIELCSDAVPSLTPTVSQTPKPVQTNQIATGVPLDNQTSIWRFYYYAGDTRIAMRLVNGTTNLVFFLFADQLGSTNVTSDQNGLTVSLSRYKPWGESNGGAGTKPTDYGFTGQRSMDYIGLDWYSSRWYDSSLGRWAQPDTMVPQASQGVVAWDRFAYVNNSPIGHNDPTGHDCGTATPGDDGCGGGAFGGGYGGSTGNGDEDINLSQVVSDAEAGASNDVTKIENAGKSALTELGDLGPRMVAAVDKVEDSLGIKEPSAEEPSTPTTTQPKGGVYTLTNPDGKVVRVGMTKNFDMRQNSYRNKNDFFDLQFNRVYYSDDKAERRGLEQYLWEDNQHPPLNINRPVSVINVNKTDYYNVGIDFLSELGTNWIPEDNNR